MRFCATHIRIVLPVSCISAHIFWKFSDYIISIHASGLFTTVQQRSACTLYLQFMSQNGTFFISSTFRSLCDWNVRSNHRILLKTCCFDPWLQYIDTNDLTASSSLTLRSNWLCSRYIFGISRSGYCVYPWSPPTRRDAGERKWGTIVSNFFYRAILRLLVD